MLQNTDQTGCEAEGLLQANSYGFSGLRSLSGASKGRRLQRCGGGGEGGERAWKNEVNIRQSKRGVSSNTSNVYK
jgi:hypothetical protein